MAIDKTQAIVIRSVDFSETSKVLTLYTADFGKMSVMAKGARRLKSNFEVALDLLSVCSICVIRKPNAELDLLTEALLVERFDGLRRDLGALYTAYYVAEVLGGLTQTGEPQPELYSETVAVLRRLAGRENEPAKEDRLSVLSRYLLSLLRILGLAPLLDACATCGGEVPMKARMTLAIESGGLVCPECSQLTRGAMSIQGGTVQAMRWLSQESTIASRLAMSETGKRELWRVLASAIEYHLGKRPKMAAMLQF